MTTTKDTTKLDSHQATRTIRAFRIQHKKSKKGPFTMDEGMRLMNRDILRYHDDLIPEPPSSASDPKGYRWSGKYAFTNARDVLTFMPWPIEVAAAGFELLELELSKNAWVFANQVVYIDEDVISSANVPLDSRVAYFEHLKKYILDKV